MKIHVNKEQIECRQLANERAKEVRNFVMSLFKDDKTIDLRVVRMTMSVARDLVIRDVQELRAQKMIDDILNS